MKALLVTLALLSAPAFATEAAEYARLLPDAKITLIDAINTAQAKAQGVAVNAELDTHKGKTVFEIEVLVGNRLFDVRLDAADGTVLSVKEDL